MRQKNAKYSDKQKIHSDNLFAVKLDLCLKGAQSVKYLSPSFWKPTSGAVKLNTQTNNLDIIVNNTYWYIYHYL